MSIITIYQVNCSPKLNVSFTHGICSNGQMAILV